MTVYPVWIVIFLPDSADMFRLFVFFEEKSCETNFVPHSDYFIVVLALLR